MNKFTSLVLACLILPGFALADPVTCGSIGIREGTLDPADLCRIGNNNPDADDIGDYYTREQAWEDAGHIDEDAEDPDGDGGVDYADGFLSIVFTSGWLNSQHVELTWTIADGFWDMFTEAVISIHVGHGRYDPDHFAWLITPGATSGTLVYNHWPRGGGGGFSNIVLWGNGPISVPEPGTLALLGAGLICIGLGRRRSRKSVS